jgi:very-short-patch-repair endonuclease/predicted transcriptional regulator of viral defense system
MPGDGRKQAATRTISFRRRKLMALAESAEREFGVLSRAELLALGFSDSAIKRLVSERRLARIHKGIYAIEAAQLSPEGRRLAAVKACGPGALLSHITAAAHHEIRATAASLIDVTVERAVNRRHMGIRVHRRETLSAEDAGIVNGIPCTSVARTLLDLASVTDDRATEKALEQAEILQIYDHLAVERLLKRMWGRPGAPRLARVAGLARPGATLTRSSLEDAMLAICRDAGLPEPEVNADVLLEGIHLEIDFVWRAARVAIEIDSWKYHRQHGQFRRDRRRDQLLELSGWAHVRFTDVEISDEPAHVEAVVRRLLARARAGQSPTR